MQPAFRAFMENILDYAGLFPPATLPMERAILNYARYRHTPDSWMLSRFVCPASRLAELRPFRDELFRESHPFQFTILAGGGDSTAAHFQKLDSDLQETAAFMELFADLARIEMFEIRLPEEVQKKISGKQILVFLEKTYQRITASGFENAAIFWEASSRGQWRDEIPLVINALSEFNTDLGNSRNSVAAGFKLRTGGVEASAFPGIEQVAFVLARCHHAGVALKMTAGLHHPLRHFNSSVNTKMHGFLNVFGAGLLLSAGEISSRELQNILEDETGANFKFEGDYFEWKDWKIGSGQIRKAREEMLISFGSCSFDEPREDLRKLGFL